MVLHEVVPESYDSLQFAQLFRIMDTSSIVVLGRQGIRMNLAPMVLGSTLDFMLSNFVI